MKQKTRSEHEPVPHHSTVPLSHYLSRWSAQTNKVNPSPHVSRQAKINPVNEQLSAEHTHTHTHTHTHMRARAPLSVHARCVTITRHDDTIQLCRIYLLISNKWHKTKLITTENLLIWERHRADRVSPFSPCVCVCVFTLMIQFIRFIIWYEYDGCVTGLFLMTFSCQLKRVFCDSSNPCPVFAGASCHTQFSVCVEF